MSKILAEFKNVYKTFNLSKSKTLKDILLNKRIKKNEFIVLENINLKIYESSSVGVVGKNGAGKSTLLLMINDIVKPDKGDVILNEKPSGFLELGSGFNPELSGEENIYLYGSLLSIPLKKIKKNFDQILKFSELGEHIAKPLRIYSQGMIARLAFSTLIQSASKLILIDEVLSVGDYSFQDKCNKYFKDFKASGGSMVIVHHTASILEKFCNYGIFLKDKKIFYEGNISLVLDKYMGRTKHWIQQMEKNILTYPMGYSEKSGLDKTNELLLSQTLKPKKQE